MLIVIGVKLQILSAALSEYTCEVHANQVDLINIHMYTLYSHLAQYGSLIFTKSHTFTMNH